MQNIGEMASLNLDFLTAKQPFGSMAARELGDSVTNDTQDQMPAYFPLTTSVQVTLVFVGVANLRVCGVV